jgi:hypothetical protein
MKKDCITRNFINLFVSPNINSVIRWEGHVTRMGEMRNEYTIFVGKPEGKRPL